MLTNQEIEVRFPEIDKGALITKLHGAGAEDRGEAILEDMIFYAQPDGTVMPEDFTRIRKAKDAVILTYKKHYEHSATGTTEIEMRIDDQAQGRSLLEAVGWHLVRHQQKKRHDFLLNGCEVSIDEYPQAAPYVEIEGPSEEALKETAALLGLDWKDVYLKHALLLLMEKRGLDVDRMKTYTFDRIEYA